MSKRGISQFSVQLFWSHGAGNLRTRALLCFRNFMVSKIFMREVDVTIFSQMVARIPFDTFMSHSTEVFVGETFNVSESLGYRDFS